ncbi:hypothetical protein [Streptomyces sp. NPDC006477]|uniref:hypothetical protein n=1 Tax=Streptomyces sp. NPDC006477 TaxID=3364747 RepID=UPI0036ABAB33
MSSKGRTTIIVIITLVWALNFVASLAIPSYNAPPEINSIFMGVVGTALATGPIASKRRRNGEEDPQEPASSEGQS